MLVLLVFWSVRELVREVYVSEAFYLLLLKVTFIWPNALACYYYEVTHCSSNHDDKSTQNNGRLTFQNGGELSSV